MRFYQQYLDHLMRQEEEDVNNDPLRKYASGYEDFLQVKLRTTFRYRLGVTWVLNF